MVEARPCAVSRRLARRASSRLGPARYAEERRRRIGADDADSALPSTPLNPAADQFAEVMGCSFPPMRKATRVASRRTGSAERLRRIELMRIGVLALQGNFREHAAVLRRLGAEAVEGRLPEQPDGLDGLVIPGGESTAITRLMRL